MIRSMMVIAAVIATSMTACGSEQKVPGYKGGCDEFAVYSQYQFKKYGAALKDKLDGEVSGEVVTANTKLLVNGWYDTGEDVYPENPGGIKGRYWFYVPKLKAWVADAGVRNKWTQPESEFTPSLAPDRPEACELKKM